MNRKPLIGMIVPILARNHIRSIVRGALAQVSVCGCDCIVLAPLCHFTQCAPAHAAAEQAIYDLIRSDAFDGFLYVKDDTTMGPAVITAVEKHLLDTNKYVMTVDEREHPFFDSTQYDDYDDFSKIVRHLIEVHGYRKIYCLTGPKVRFQAQTRLQAYQDQMMEHGLYFDESYYCYGTFWVDSAAAYAQRIISGELSRPEAVVCGNDASAMAFIKTLTAAGIRVPDEIAVTGYDGYPFAANVDITLTTFNRNHYQLGADAARRLYRNLTGMLCEKARRQKSGFIVGNSCGCSSIPAQQILPEQNDSVSKMWAEDVFCDDLPYDLATARNLSELLPKAMYHAGKLYQVQSLHLYLNEPDGSLRCAASLEHDADARIVFPADDVRKYLKVIQEPEIVFLSPLHILDRTFGMAALSFGNSERIYEQYYLRFVTHTALALDRLLHEHLETEDSARSSRQKEVMQKLMELRSRMMDDPGQPWTVEEMSRNMGMGKSTLQKQYKSFFGKSIFEELIRFRVELAKHLLKDTTLTLSEVAEKCGYSSESYFMKQFKSVAGITPTAFRKHDVLSKSEGA